MEVENIISCCLSLFNSFPVGSLLLYRQLPCFRTYGETERLYLNSIYGEIDQVFLGK